MSSDYLRRLQPMTASPDTIAVQPTPGTTGWMWGPAGDGVIWGGLFTELPPPIGSVVIALSADETIGLYMQLHNFFSQNPEQLADMVAKVYREAS